MHLGQRVPTADDAEGVHEWGGFVKVFLVCIPQAPDRTQQFPDDALVARSKDGAGLIGPRSFRNRHKQGHRVHLQGERKPPDNRGASTLYGRFSEKGYTLVFANSGGLG